MDLTAVSSIITQHGSFDEGEASMKLRLRGLQAMEEASVRYKALHVPRAPQLPVPRNHSPLASPQGPHVGRCAGRK